MEFKTLLERDFILLDGAMGTMLQRKGLAPGASSELVALEHPEWLEEIHRAYLEAGSHIIYADTFGANREKLAPSGRTPREVIGAAVGIARRAAEPYGALVALDIGPLGRLLAPAGDMTFEEAYDLFAEMMEAGAEAGADLVVLETMADLQELRAGILAAKERTGLPVICTMTFDRGGRTFMGCSAASMALTAEGMGVEALGVNCSLGPRELPPLIETLRQWTTLPLIAKPNAGLPSGEGAGYDITPEEFAASQRKLAEMGVKLLGGCCGTDPGYIALLKRELEGLRYERPETYVPPALCTEGAVLPLDQVRTVGERLNPAGRPGLCAALQEEDEEELLDRAQEQLDDEADLLDLNVAAPGVEEAHAMAWAVNHLRGLVQAPLMIDSADPAALEAGLRAFCGKGVLNSVTGDKRSLERLLSVARRYGAAVVGMTLDEGGVPETAEGRVAIAGRIVEAARACGIPKQDIFIDCMVTSEATDPEGAEVTLEALRQVKRTLGVKTVLGISNCSHGLPDREAVNRAFLARALEAGLDLPILDPGQDL